jgi:SAM-dependent methyltransferase
VTAEYAYVGDELDLFARAVNWKAYWSSRVRPYLAGDVLEVGAGIGANTALLLNPAVRQWVCVEPDRTLAERLGGLTADAATRLRVVVGTLDAIGRDERFDAVLYIDVLEHIEDAAREARQAVSHLKPGGVLIVLAPAHQWLFSAFDEAVGHFRRYTRTTLAAVVPAGLTTEQLVYLDALGLLTSLGNRLVLNKWLPTPSQIQLWDRGLVPWSRRIDPWLGYRLGKTVLGIWRRE